MSDYEERKYTITCSPEAKKFIDEYTKKKNISRKDLIDYMCLLVSQNEDNTKESPINQKNTSDIEIKKTQNMIKVFTEKIIELLNRLLLLSVLKQDPDIDQLAIKTKGEKEAKEFVNFIFNVSMYGNSMPSTKNNEKRNNSTFSEEDAKIFLNGI